MNSFTYITNSPIHGIGVFASQDIPKGSKIADYYGEEMDWKTFKIKYGEYKSNSEFTYPMRRIWRIIVAKDEPYRSNNLINFINENKVERNCHLRLRALYACQDIPKNSELFLEYPKDYNRYWESNL
jgi:hypothetical protein